MIEAHDKKIRLFSLIVLNKAYINPILLAISEAS